MDILYIFFDHKKVYQNSLKKKRYDFKFETVNLYCEQAKRPSAFYMT